MTFLIVTHVVHCKENGIYSAYGPYVREMNLWIQQAKRVIIVAPLSVNQKAGEIDLAYQHPNISVIRVPAFELTSFTQIIHTVCCLPYILLVLFIGMFQANHIHLRCPGNMGLLGCVVQILFPGKKKTAKYAGNWDWNSHQPWSYRLQQRILRNTFLTHNSQTLVYGEWPDRNQNILPFYTASYSESDAIETKPRPIAKDTIIRLLFVGSLTQGKRPMECLLLANALQKKGITTELHFYGEGPLKSTLLSSIEESGMTGSTFLHGNVNSETLKKAYQTGHFLLLLSESEGWPKAIAEAMWWGCVPISTPVSCVPWMLNHQQRGLLVPNSNHLNIESIVSLISDPVSYTMMAQSAMQWARTYTLEKFKLEIEKLV